ncbi:MAG: flagellar filament capping protein FliD [Gammaproteobacteria bacterium]|nr:flagellar filament capping protein FliD [Gammaproteobacteria bacterium]
MTSSTNGNGLIQALGIGSGLDIQTLVSKLVAAERAPVESRLTRQAASVATRLSALGALKGTISTFQGALEPLRTESAFLARSATSADEDVFAASAGTSAAAGRYAIEVRQLAQPEQLISTAFGGGASTAVGTGTLTLGVGSDSFAVTIAAGTNTLADIRDAINAATDNPGLSATLVYGVDGAQLVLTSEATGEGNAITVSASGGDGGLAQLAYAAGNTGNYTQSQAAQDAIVVVSGVEHHSDSNVVEGAIDDVTLTLKSTNAGATVALAVASDQDAVLANIRRFVSAYNDMESQFRALGSYDAASGKGGPMLGDWLLNGVRNAMVRGAADGVTGAGPVHGSLAAIGITTGSDGKLAIDEERLAAALQSGPTAVAALFGGEAGVAARLDDRIEELLASDGSIAARSDNLAEAQKQLDAASRRLDQRMATVEQRYLAQFSALDSLMAQMNSTSSYLTQQLSSLNSMLQDYNRGR